MVNKNIKILIKIIFIYFIIFWIYITNANLVYPIQTMSKLECRFQDYSTLGEDCKMSLPILKTSDYTKYKNDYNLYRRVYTILWWSTYNFGWDVGNWWHQWVDIASAKWTPVYSISDWKVVFTWNLAGRGNTVKIEYTINNRKIYANYSHLSKIDVSVWDEVKSMEKIWEVWSTWNSSWNHLHFQIDLTLSWKWPWYRSNCSEKNYNKIVNSNVCFEGLNNNTIDPLLFLETWGAIIKQATVEKPKLEIISQTWLLSRKEILKREIDDFLKNYDIKVSILNFWWNLELGKSGTVRIKVIDKRTKKPFNWSFPGDMNFKFDGKKFDIFPTGILQIDNWLRDFKITPKMEWKMNLDIYIWETFFKKLNFGVFNKSRSIIPKSWVFWLNKKNVISDNKTWLLYFKDNFWLNILWTNFDWEFIIKSENNTTKFCIKKASDLTKINYTINTKCKEENFSYEQKFSYKDTTFGVLIFDYKVLNIWVNNIIVVNSKNTISSKKVEWVLPEWLNVNYAYYDSVVNISKLWLSSWINKWYFLQDRELNREDWINFLKNTIEYKISKCQNDICKNEYFKNIALISKLSNDKYSYFTREEFIALIWEYFVLEEYNWNDYMQFRDLNEKLQNYSKNIFKKNTWKDYFWQTKYFQPNKKITRGEASYLIDMIL